MGMLMSYLGAGEGIASEIKGEGIASEKRGEGFANKTLTLVMATLYEEFHDQNIRDVDSFHLAILDMFNSVNKALPGKHYDPPSPKELEAYMQDLLKAWPSTEEERRKHFTEFMEKHVNLGKVDRFMMVTTGFLAPPAAMAAKRTGQVLPQLRFMTSIPDVILVPAATIMALIAFKFSKIKLTKKVPEKPAPEESKGKLQVP